MTVTLRWVDMFLIGSILTALCSFSYWRGRRVEAQYWIRQNKAQIEVLNGITKLLNGRIAAQRRTPNQFRQ